MAKDKQFSEPEETMTEVENIADLDPMAQPVNEKSYSRPNVNISQKDLMSDIPEPSFTPPPIDLGEPPIEEKPKKKEPEKPFNPEINELSKKEKEFATDHVAEVIMQGYEWIHDAANKGMVFNENKLNKMAREGEIDFSIQIPYDYATGSTMSAGEFIQEYNNQNKDALTVSPEFKEKTMPVLKRVLQKRGIGMTDEQYLIYLFGKDIAVKGVMFGAARSQMKEILNMMKEMTESQKGPGYINGGSPMPTPPPPPPPQPTSPVNEYVEHGSEIIEIDEPQDYDNKFVDDDVVGTVAEQVEAQFQNKTVAQLRREQIEAAKNAQKNKPKGTRGRKKKNP